MKIELNPTWQTVLETNCHFYHRYTLAAKKWMQHMMTEIMSKTKFVGVGLEVTEEMKLTIVAWASRMLMGRKLGPFFFSHVHVVEVYAGAKVSKDALGLIYDGVIQCQICLAWEDILKDIKNPNCGSNTILHEFAHALDQIDRLIDGIPKMMLRGEEADKWNSVFKASYILENPNGKRIWDYFDLDRYGHYDTKDPSCVNLSEMFAIGTEKYFEDSEGLKKHAPELFEQLQVIYKTAI